MRANEEHEKLWHFQVPERWGARERKELVVSLDKTKDNYIYIWRRCSAIARGVIGINNGAIH